MPIGEIHFMKKLSAVKLNFMIMLLAAASVVILQSCGEKPEETRCKR